MSYDKLCTFFNIIFITILLSAYSGPLYCQQDIVRGVWLTNVASDALDSRENIKKAVRLCKKSCINNIYVVTWNRARTLYPSAIMNEKFGVSIMERFSGRDPLREVIEEAHNKGIKVHAWFEFGFSCSYMENDGGIILQKYPEWAALNKEGKIVSKNGFQWMNALNPDVQDFMSSLILEVVANYPLDGIQGDDRLPAMPSEAGYDLYTVNLYKSQHNGIAPPTDSRDQDWINWRSDILTCYLGKLYRQLKGIRPDLIISMAPSIHPWAKEQYLQDWPKWMRLGYTDYVCPQVYRYNIGSYQSTLLSQIRLLKEDEKNRFFPGVLLMVNGKIIPSEGLLDSIVLENRKNGIMGECFFYFEGLKNYKKYFKKYK